MNETLKKQAEALGIDVDRRWSDETLQEKINEAKSKANPAPLADQSPAPADPAPMPGGPKPQAKPTGAKKTPVRLLHDTWFEADVRTPAGKVVDVDVETAKKLIADGKAVRADPLPE
jgi:hypothetical protein